MAEQKNDKPVAIDLDTLKELIKEIKAPSPLELDELESRKEEREARQRVIEQEQQTRLETASQKLEEIEARKIAQQTCLHEGGRPVHPYSVFIADPFGGYILCQKCQAVIRPEEQRKHYPANYGGTVIFDTRLYNTLFQKTSESGMFA